MKKIYLLFAALLVITCAKEEDPIVTPPAVVIPPPSFVIPPVTSPETSTPPSYDGGDISIVTNPDQNPANGNESSTVAKLVKDAGQVWGGSVITVSEPLSFVNSTTVTAKVWSPRVGLNLLIKFEDATPFPNTIASAEITATSTVANQWEVLTFDFAGISTDIDFTNVVLIMDNGTEGDGSDNYTIYVDDIDIN